jgi:hypothetical protein
MINQLKHRKMKRIYLTVISLFFIIPLFASELVLIPVKSFEETKSLFKENSLTIHLYNDDFVVATSENENQENFILLDKNPWETNQSYYLVYIDGTVSKAAYISRIKPVAEILFEGTDFIIIRTDEQKNGQLPPAKNDGMVRINKSAAKLPSYKLSQKAYSPSEADPFIIELLNEVSATSITSTVQHLQDYGTRNAYNAQSVVAQQWISTQFEALELDVEVMDFTMPGGSASDNVIATLVGTTYPDEYVVVGGHYDSYSYSGLAPGADDNASGTAAVLEIAQILSNYEFDRSIIFCAFSGEEYGLYGSAAFAHRSSQQELNILGYFNLDMIGYLALGSTMKTTVIYPQSAKELADYYTNICSIYLPSFVVETGYLSGGDSDHTSFNNNGFMGIFPFENINAYSPYIHSSNDIIGVSYNNEDQAEVFTKAALASVVSLANSEVTGVSTSTSKLGIYPNPARDYVTVTFNGMQEAKLEVINRLGQIIIKEHIYSNQRINTSNWPNDVYILRVVSENGIVTKRLVKN